MPSQGPLNPPSWVLPDLAPERKKAGVVLGLEDTISAKNNGRIMERSLP